MDGWAKAIFLAGDITIHNYVPTITKINTTVETDKKIHKIVEFPK